MTNDEAEKYGKQCALDGKLYDQALLGVKEAQKRFVLQGYYKGSLEKKQKDKRNANSNRG